MIDLILQSAIYPILGFIATQIYKHNRCIGRIEAKVDALSK